MSFDPFSTCQNLNFLHIPLPDYQLKYFIGSDQVLTGAGHMLYVPAGGGAGRRRQTATELLEKEGFPTIYHSWSTHTP